MGSGTSDTLWELEADASLPTTSAPRKYGRGKFTPHPERVAYMEAIVRQPPYSGVPGAVDNAGRVEWQVSSGKTTSFNRLFQARWDWWVDRADELDLPGTGNDLDRFTIAARMIHPTGYRPCYVCGEDFNVGYFYANKRLAQRLNDRLGQELAHRGDSIPDVLAQCAAGLGTPDAHRLLAQLFPERGPMFAHLGFSVEAFEETNHLPTAWLSPGFMGDAPYRLDGLHDYCLTCREGNDPGRAVANLRSYAQDRRAFEQWAEGNWKLTIDLYNSAGPGECSRCHEPTERVSPDHVGPLACGFKQIPLFVPTCPRCNSSRNRRLRLEDLKILRDYEAKTGDSVASWQVRGLWEAGSAHVTSDSGALELSSRMRALQDCYLRTLFALLEAGRAGFLVSLLHPEYASRDHEFRLLDRGKLTYSNVKVTEVDTSGRRSLAARSVRIAFDALGDYVTKTNASRRFYQGFVAACPDLVAEILEVLDSVPLDRRDQDWQAVALSHEPHELRERAISDLLPEKPGLDAKYGVSRHEVSRIFYDFGSAAAFASSS